MNFLQKFFRAADFILVLILIIQIFEIKEASAIRVSDEFQNLKDTVLQAGKDFFGAVWDDRRETEENTSMTEENSAGKDNGDAEEENSAGKENGDAAEENSAGKDNGDAAEENSVEKESGDMAEVFFAGEEELTAETAAANESVREITVLITNKGEGGYWHSTLSFSFADDVLLTTAEGVTYLKAGDMLELEASDYAVGESFSLETVNRVSGENTAAFTLDFSAEIISEDNFSEEKLSAGTGSSDVRTYAGTMNIEVTKDGFLLRNTLPLEEYLRYVVPAEMPAAYPEEALKAQAICARTYALRMAASGTFAKYGADISDDTSCQVYNTQGTDERTDAAVLATAGEYLVYGGEPAECYYFSTSCGVTTDAAIWGEEIPYLQSVLVGAFLAEETENPETSAEETDNPETSAEEMENPETSAEETENPESSAKKAETPEILAEETGTEAEETSMEETIQEIEGVSEKGTTSEIGELLKEEECLRSFLSDTAFGAESDETWYRWKAFFSTEILESRMEETIGKVLAVEVTQRGSGGVAAELTVYGSSGQKVIESQYAIREFFRLGDGATCTVQDGTVYSDSMLLPSAFFYIQTEADGTITLVGGGFGHGCGMSQNAAKAYAKEGADAYEILSFFYSGTKIYMAAAVS